MLDLEDYLLTLKFMPYLEMKKKIKMVKKKLYHLANIWKKLMKEPFNKENFVKKNRNNNSNILKRKSNRIDNYLNIYMNNYTIVLTKGEYSLIYS